MKIEFQFSFRSKSLTKESYIEIINDFYFFTPIITIINDKSVRKKDKTNLIKFCENLPDISRILTNNEEFGFLVCEVTKIKPSLFISISISLPYSLLNEMESIINKWILKDGFLSFYIVHSEYYRAQNQPSLEEFYNDLRAKYVGDYTTIIEPWGWERVDISKNPGRRGYTKNGIIAAAWKMWFSKAMQDEYPQISNLPFAPFVYKTEKVFNDILFVQLFENIEDSYSKEGKDIQQSFLKWIDFDNIAIL